MMHASVAHLHKLVRLAVLTIELMCVGNLANNNGASESGAFIYLMTFIHLFGLPLSSRFNPIFCSPRHSILGDKRPYYVLRTPTATGFNYYSYAIIFSINLLFVLQICVTSCPYFCYFWCHPRLF